MIERLDGRTTETSKGNRQSKGCQTLRRVQHAMRHLPIQVDDVTVNVEKRQGTPCSGPIQRAEGERKLVDAVWLDHVLREEVKVTGLGGHARHWGANQGRADTDCQGIKGGRKGTI